MNSPPEPAAELPPAPTEPHPARAAGRAAPALLALAICTFAIGTTEFVITGLLPEIAVDYEVSIVTAGYLVSGYALGVVVGAPVVTAAVLRLPRKRVLLGLLVLFVTGNLLSATVPGFTTLVIGSAGSGGNNTMAASAAVAAFNLGNAAGAYFGGLAIASGLGYASTSLAGAAMAAAALVLAAGSAKSAIPRRHSGRDAGTRGSGQLPDARRSRKH